MLYLQNPRCTRNQSGGHELVAARDGTGQTARLRIIARPRGRWLGGADFNQLKLAESEEMRADRKYLEDTAAKLSGQGIKVTARLALGDPPKEILKMAESEVCDLIAMTSHGHRLLGDLFFGSTIHEVRHNTKIPVLLVRAGT